MTLKIDFKPCGDHRLDTQRLQREYNLSYDEASNVLFGIARGQNPIVDLRSSARQPTQPQSESQAKLLADLTRKYVDAGLDYDEATERAYAASQSPEGARMLSSSQLTGPPTSGMAGYGPNTSTPGSAKRDAEALSSLGTKLSAKAISDFVKSQASLDDVSTLLEAVGSRLDQLAVSQPDAVKAVRKQWTRGAR